jgi:hypothetical protein
MKNTLDLKATLDKCVDIKLTENANNLNKMIAIDVKFLKENNSKYTLQVIKRVHKPLQVSKKIQRLSEMSNILS